MWVINGFSDDKPKTAFANPCAGFGKSDVTAKNNQQGGITGPSCLFSSEEEERADKVRANKSSSVMMRVKIFM
jgi:hypothetical protein